MLTLTDHDEEAAARLRAHDEALEQWFGQVSLIKERLSVGDLETAAEQWYLIPEATRLALWISTRSGGCWSPAERATMKTSAFRLAYFGRINGTTDSGSTTDIGSVGLLPDD